MRILTLSAVLFLTSCLLGAAQAQSTNSGTVLSIEQDNRVTGIAELLPYSLSLKVQGGEVITYFVRNNSAMSELVAQPQRYQGQAVKVMSSPLPVTLDGREVNISPAYQVELAEVASEGSGDKDRDAAIITGCQDDVMDVLVQRKTIPDAELSTYQMQILNVYRGDDSKTGRTLEAFWDGTPPKTGEQYTVMGREKDGFFHVDAKINYRYDLDTTEWIYKLTNP